jgi:hypothetical protein
VKLRTLTLILPLAIALAVTPAVTQDDPLAGHEFRELVLADGSDPEAWVPAECEITSSEEHAREGASVLFHVPVDHFAGEIKYPIGWPRMYLPFAEDFDFLSMWVYTDTSREKLPRTALGFAILCPDRNSQWTRTLNEVEKGEWVRVVVPLSLVPDLTNCTSIKFHISESNYQHEDIVDFYVDDVKLLAYAEPTILELTPLTGLMYADATSLRVQVRVAGLADDIAADMTCVLKRDGQTLAEENLAVTRGAQSLLMTLGSSQLAPGECTLEATIAGGHTVTQTIRIVASPWE